MQQKYWDQGRSDRAVDHHVADLLAPAVPAVAGGKARKASIFPSAKSCIDSSAGCVTQCDVLAGVQADIGHHAGEEDVLGAPSCGTATVFPFRSRMARTRSVAEQLEAADVDPRQEHERVARSSWVRAAPTKFRPRSTSPAASALWNDCAASDLDVLHLGEPLALQELFGHILGRHTDAGDLDQPEPSSSQAAAPPRPAWGAGRGAPPSLPASPRPGTSAG